jgi:hypothetical protein
VGALLGDYKYDISQIPHDGEIENLIVLDPYSSTIIANRPFVSGSAALTLSERDQTKEAELKEAHARMTENLKKYGPVLGYIYKSHGTQSCPEIGDAFSLMGLAEPRIEPEFVFELAPSGARLRARRDRVISLSLLFFHVRLELIAHLGNHGSNRSNRLLDIGVKSTSGRFLNSFYPSRGTFSWQAPKADKYQSIGDLKLDGMRHFTHGAYRS